MKTRLFFVGVFFLISFLADAQQQTTDGYNMPVYTNDKHIPSYFFVPDDIGALKFNVKDSNKKSIIKNLLKLNEETTLMLADTLTDIAGGFHESYKQYYKGLEVDGARCVVHYTGNGQAKMISGNLKTIENKAIEPTIRKEQAKSLALHSISFKEKIKNKKTFVNQDSVDIDSILTFRQESLVIYVKEMTPYLAYKYVISSIAPELNQCVYVDANRGTILDKETTICNVSATVSTLYSGIQTIETQYYQNYYRLRDYTRGYGIETFQYNTFFMPNDFISTNNTWTNLSNFDRDALDVHWGVEKTYDYYLNKFGRNSYDNQGSKIVSYVNKNDTNAYWNMSESYMVYGQMLNHLPYVSLDVTAHEITHGVTQHTSNLKYEKESGAINEGLSDVFGVCVENEYKLNSGNNIWKIGEDFKNGGLRDLSNPTCKYYHGTGWANTDVTPCAYNDMAGVHTNSGVFGYWFYLLVNGDSGTNEGGYTYTVSPISIDTAIQICYLANAVFLSSDSKYIDARYCTLYAAQALGLDSNVINNINNAWDAVGVYINFAGNYMIYNSAIYMVPSIPDTCSVANWTLSGYNAQNFIIEENTPTANQCKITRKIGVDFSGSYYLTLTAQVMHNGTAIKTINKQLIAPYIEGNVVPCGYNVYSVVPHVANSTIEWEAEGSNITSPTDPLPSLPPEDPYAYVIANTEGRDIYGTLTATLKVGGSVIGTLEKVLDMSGLFSGTWWQQASALDTTNASPTVFHHQDMLDIVPSRTVYLQSDDFIGANITKTISNMIALGWTNSNGIISFTPLLPINGGLGSITIEGTYPNSCRHFKLRLLTMSNFDDPILLSINPSGQTCGFSLISNQSAEHSTSSNSDIPTEWRLTITKSETGRRVFDSAVSGMSKTINTTEWRPGVYIAVAQVGKFTLSGKFAIER